MPGKPTKRFVCPTCEIPFVAPDSTDERWRTKGKRCPAGHFHTYTQLHQWAATHESEPKEPPVEKPDPDAATYRDLVVAMMASYDRTISTLPPRAAALVQGAFGHIPDLARRALEAPR